MWEMFSGTYEAVQYLQSVFAKANLVYTPQMNLVLSIHSVYIPSATGNSESWNSCTATPGEQLAKMQAWAQNPVLGLWHLFDDCFLGTGQIGLANTGVACHMEPTVSLGHNYYTNVGVTWHNWRTW